MGPARPLVALVVSVALLAATSPARAAGGTSTSSAAAVRDRAFRLKPTDPPERLWDGVVRYREAAIFWEVNAKTTAADLRAEKRIVAARDELLDMKDEIIARPPPVQRVEVTPAWVWPTVVGGGVAAVAIAIATFFAGKASAR